MMRWLAVLVLLCIPTSVLAGNVDGRWDHIAQDMKDWFRSQRNPHTKISCCDESDGEQVEEDIRNGEYWVRSPMSGGEWMRVPPENVIQAPNKWGRAVAWYRRENGVGPMTVYCFIPGAGI